MNIMPTAQIRQIRCPKCGNSFLPEHKPGMLTVCPVVGCNTAFDPDNLPDFPPDPERMNLVPGARTGMGDAPSPLNFGRNEAGEFIVTGVNGTHTSITVPGMVNGRAVMGIAPRAFADQTTLRRVTLPDTVTTIGEEAFAGCYNLESVTFGKGLTLLDMGCFRDCERLDSITLPGKVEEIGRDAFARCTALFQVEITSKIRVIRDGAFAMCGELSSFTWTTRPQRVAPGAFAGCYVLPQSVQDELFSTTAQ